MSESWKIQSLTKNKAEVIQEIEMMNVDILIFIKKNSKGYREEQPTIIPGVGTTTSEQVNEE